MSADLNDNLKKRKQDKVLKMTQGEQNQNVEIVKSIKITQLKISNDKKTKLKKAGIETVEQLSMIKVSQLMAILRISELDARLLVEEVYDALNVRISFREKATTTNKNRNEVCRLTTGSKRLNSLFLNYDQRKGKLVGGIHKNSVVEFFGKSTSGKTQIAHTLCVYATQPIEKGGLDGDVIYIDTELGFRPERILQIAKENGIDGNKVLERIEVIKPLNSFQQELIINEFIYDEFRTKPVKLIIVDSIIAKFRAEYIKGTRDNIKRQQILAHMIESLKKLTLLFDVMVIYTNQVGSYGNGSLKNQIKWSGGNVMAHYTPYRIYLRRGKQPTKRYAKMLKDSGLPEREVSFYINRKGITDEYIETTKEIFEDEETEKLVF
ncbi:MAG: hypothetical protein ACFFCE_01660 [Promethearchaeota archaeon]